MLGIRFGFYTEDKTIAWQIDSLIDYMEDNYNKMIALSFKPMVGAPVEATDIANFYAYYDLMIPFLTNRLSQHDKKFIAGTDKLTIADLKVY